MSTTQSPTAVDTAAPFSADRQVLIDACGERGHLDDDGRPLSDKALYRRAQIQTHPDIPGRDPAAYDRVVNAAIALKIINDKPLGPPPAVTNRH